jgi:putative membrane protein
MIHNFSDHAANERTFLAWVRTALALMALGFLVTRFNLFLRIAAQSSSGGGARGIAMPSGRFGDIAGLLLILAGTAMVAAAAIRFIRIGRAIDSPEQRVDGSRMDLALTGLLLVLGIALALFLSHSLLTGL